jgi:U3 small nucleolar RNA-associated protein 5
MGFGPFHQWCVSRPSCWIITPKQPVAGPSRIKANATQAPPPPAPVAAFNPSRTLFACAQPVLGSADKLTVWDIIADRVIAEWEVEGAAKATTVSWGSISSGAARKKRKKKSNSNDTSRSSDATACTRPTSSRRITSPRLGANTTNPPLSVVRATTSSSPSPFEFDFFFRVHAVASDDRLVLVTAKEVLVVDSDLSAVSHTFALPAGTQAPTSASLLPTSTADGTIPRMWKLAEEQRYV